MENLVIVVKETPSPGAQPFTESYSLWEGARMQVSRTPTPTPTHPYMFL